MKEFIDIYIPRILGTINQNYVKKSFHTLNVGKIIFIDMYKKINENGYPYSFAFITLELYDSKLANLLKERITTKKIMHLVYDDENNQYWEIKQHIPKEHRTVQANVKNTVASFYNDAEKERLLNEYKELEKELFALVC